MQMFVLMLCVGVALSTPVPQSSTELTRREERRPVIPIVTYQNAPTNGGGNKHAFTSGNGIEREEGVFIKEIVTKDEDGKEKIVKVPVYRGSYKYQQADGTFIDVQYIADETGFHPIGDSIPKALQ